MSDGTGTGRAIRRHPLALCVASPAGTTVGHRVDRDPVRPSVYNLTDGDAVPVAVTADG